MRFKTLLNQKLMSAKMVMLVVVIETQCLASHLGKVLHLGTLVKSLNMGDMGEAKKSQQTRRIRRISVQVNHTMRKEVISHFQRLTLQAEEPPYNQDRATTYFDITDIQLLK